MPRLLQVVHGYPPRENAGTERHAWTLAAGLSARGWTVHTFAATLLPGARMYSLLEAPGVTRIVNNAPYAALRSGATDPAVDRAFAELAARFRPDVIHVHHHHALSTTLPSPAPMIWTLHDAWGWCASGGLLLHHGRACAGPSRECAGCASEWVRDSPTVATALRAAGIASRVVRPERLHAAWRRLPARFRALADGPGPAVDSSAIDRRTAAFQAFSRRAHARIAPSRWLADAAEANGLGTVEVVPQAMATSAVRRVVDRDAPFVFLGTLARHKGPDLVVEAHRRSGVRAGLQMYGPPGTDAAFSASLPHSGFLAPERVPEVLARARALVLGSIWPEPAPLVVLEARAVGCPVVAPRIGGLPEMVSDEDGWLYAPGDVDDLGAALRIAEREPRTSRPPPSFDAHLDAIEAIYDRASPRRG